MYQKLATICISMLILWASPTFADTSIDYSQSIYINIGVASQAKTNMHREREGWVVQLNPDVDTYSRFLTFRSNSDIVLTFTANSSSSQMTYQIKLVDSGFTWNLSNGHSINVPGEIGHSKWVIQAQSVENTQLHKAKTIDYHSCLEVTVAPW